MPRALHKEGPPIVAATAFWGVVYVLAHDLHPSLSVIGCSRDRGTATDAASKFCHLHGLDGWSSFSELECLLPSFMVKRIHEEVRRRGLEYRTVPVAQGL